jgi:hypothetical protein
MTPRRPAARPSRRSAAAAPACGRPPQRELTLAKLVKIVARETPRGAECRDCVSVGDTRTAGRARSKRVWNTFRNDQALQRALKVSAAEVEMLAQVALMGEIHQPCDLVFILETLRSAFQA